MKRSLNHLVVYIALFATATFGGSCRESGSTSRPPSDARQPTGAGDEVGDTTVKLAIKGMHCQGCVTTITTEVQTLEGVRDVRVSLQDAAAWVTVDRPERIEPVIHAIDSLGYRANVAGGPSATTSAPAD